LFARQVKMKQSERKSSIGRLPETIFSKRAGAVSSTRYLGANASKTMFRRRRAVMVGNSPDARALLNRSGPAILASHIATNFRVQGPSPTPAWSLVVYLGASVIARS